MTKQVFIINGSGGVGKDTFVSYVTHDMKVFNFYNGECVENFSSVDKVKQLAKMAGWDGGKSEKDRKFLSDLKNLCTEYNDMPFRSMQDKVDEFKKSEAQMLFLHIREPKEIERAAKAFNVITVLIKRDSVAHITSNTSDGSVFDYNYDIVIENNGSLEELRHLAKSFVFDFLKVNSNLKAKYTANK